MTEQQKKTPADDLGNLVALLEIANSAASELARLQTEHRRLQDEFLQTEAVVTRGLDSGHLPVTELAELTRIDGALSDVEVAISAVLTRLQATFSSPSPVDQ